MLKMTSLCPASSPATMSNMSISDDVLAKVAALDVFDVSGNAIKFGSLYEARKTIVVFVRQSSSLGCDLALIRWPRRGQAISFVECVQRE
jgi:hypothetical protein